MKLRIRSKVAKRKEEWIEECGHILVISLEIQFEIYVLIHKTCKGNSYMHFCKHETPWFWYFCLEYVFPGQTIFRVLLVQLLQNVRSSN